MFVCSPVMIEDEEAGFPIFLFAYLMTKAYMGRERKTEEILLMFVVRNLVLRRSGVERV